MARSPRQLPPSAMDGYRRLARTRHTVTTTGGDAVLEASVGAADPGRPARGRRVAGTIRLAGFVAVVALIIGTSVSLASTEQRDTSGDAAADRDTSPQATTPSTRVEPTRAAADAPVAAADAAPEMTAARVVTASAPPPAAALPFTGPPRLELPLLGGALLMLAGMLVQIAGQPVPARTRARGPAG